jgi:hypothetical protein
VFDGVHVSLHNYLKTKAYRISLATRASWADQTDKLTENQPKLATIKTLNAMIKTACQANQNGSPAKQPESSYQKIACMTRK